MTTPRNTDGNMKILFIPSWIDVEFKSPAQSTFTNFPKVIGELDGIETGMIYAEMHVKQFRRKYITVNSLPYPYLGMRAWAPPKRGRLWNIWIKKYLELYEKFVEKYWKPDVIHAHSVLAAIAAMHIGEKHDIPYILTEHLPVEKIKDLPKGYHEKYQQVGKTAHTLTTVSSEGRDFLEKKLSRTVKRIHNFVDIDFFNAKNKITEAPVFISIGEPAYTKGLDNILKCFPTVKEAIPDAILILVDKISDRKVYVDPIIKKKKLKQSVVLTGIVDKNEVKRLLQSAAVYVSASRQESFGMTMVEALASGTPLVATKTAGSNEIFKGGTGLQVNQDDNDALAEAMIEVYRNRENYKPNKLHNYVMKKFSQNMILPKWKNIYRNV